VLDLSRTINGLQRLGQDGPKHSNDQTTFPATTYRMFDATGVKDYNRNFLTSHQYYRLSPTVRDAIAVDIAPVPNVWELASLVARRTRAPTDRRSPLDEALLERCVGLCRKQALRRVACFRRRSALEECLVQRTGARLGTDQDGRSFGTRWYEKGACNAGMARHEWRSTGAVDRQIFLPPEASGAQSDRSGRQSSGRATRWVRPDFWRLVPRIALHASAARPR